MRYIYKILLLSFFLFTISCEGNRKTKNQPFKSFQDAKYLELNTKTKTPYKIHLQESDTVENGKDFFMKGYIGDIDIDGQDRIYVTGNGPGSAQIFIFESNGNHMATIGEYGRGPGEYESISSINILENKLYLIDTRLQKFGIFSIGDFTHIKDELIRRDSLNRNNSMSKRLRVKDFSVTNNENIVLEMSMISPNKETDISKIQYFKISGNWNILSDSLFELERFHFYFPETNGFVLPFTMPFTRNSLTAISKEGRFFTIWTEDLFLKVYDEEGNYEKAIHYKMKKAPLLLSELNISKQKRQTLKKYELPDTWPAVHAMEMDDNGRLWIATITNSDSTFQWWVIDQEGEIFSKFTLSGERSTRSVMTKPIYKIKNGFFYKHERDVRNGVDRIIKYKIEFTEH